MIDFTDEQKMVRQMVREWAKKELAPLVPKMERGEILPYDAMRKLIRQFGMDEMVRAAFKKKSGDATKSADRDPAADAGLMSVVSLELARVCPGFTLAFGATLGLAGGAIMAKGTAAQKER